jgi:hypothetical protein
MPPQKLSAIFLTVTGMLLMLGGQWALTPGNATQISPPILGAALSLTPSVGLILLALASTACTRHSSDMEVVGGNFHHSVAFQAEKPGH